MAKGNFYRNPSVNIHQFSMIPKADVPRSSFRMQKTVKTTFDASFLVPMFCEEVLPGDSFNVHMTAFCRLATPIVPVMDNMVLDTFFFFVPNRLVWNHWEEFMGQQDAPGDSISYVIPQIVSKAGGYDVNSLYDYFGLPTAGQITGSNTFSHSALPIRGYALIFNEWFRDENLVGPLPMSPGDGPDLYTGRTLQRRGKRHDYFTACLPWTQKGNPVSLPLGTQAPVVTAGADTGHYTGNPLLWKRSDTNLVPGNFVVQTGYSTGAMSLTDQANTSDHGPLYPSNLVTDLSAATAATINQLRQAFQIQKLLERDARGGTRYTEIVRSHFGVISPDARLQRPEYLGGGSTPVTFNAVAQTSGTSVTGSDTPLANLSAFGTILSKNNSFTRSFTEHGYIIGIMNVRADLTYQQGLRRHWSRQTRYDFYFPAFAMLGEQAVLNQEIYCTGTGTDDDVFGYQERWAEYRYNPSEITGLFRSTASGTIDVWHLAQKFSGVPLLNDSFIEEHVPVDRIVAVEDEANGQQFLCDMFFDIKAARPLPMYSVPGLIDHF